MRISDWSSDVFSSDLPLGPSRRRYANAVALVASKLSPPEMLGRLQEIEARFGRRTGQRWSARTLDLDILLWSGGAWSDGALTIPHPAMTQRAFVLGPLRAIVPEWRSEEHTSELQSLMRISYAVFCLKKKKHS